MGKKNSLSLKRLTKALLPPIILKSLKTWKQQSKCYDSYDEAMKDADGYGDETLTKCVIAKSKIFSEKTPGTKELDLTSLRTFVGLASVLNNEKLTVIDFGGAAGTHFHIAKTILPNDIIIDWRVVETREMVGEAKKQGLETAELKFYDSIQSATLNAEIDLVFASSSIHYTPDPYDCLRSLAAVNAKKLMITRTPITDFPTILLQRSLLSANGVGEIPDELGVADKVISYPVTIMDRAEVEKLLASFGDIVLKISEDKGVLSSRARSFDMWGYVVSK